MKVDIVIPSKDRPAQLHQLLSLLSKNVKGIGQITITIQASNSEYKRGYEILNDRLLKDDHFNLLRKKSNIVVLYRDQLSEVGDAFNHLGNSELLLFLADDELFFGNIDLENNLAVKKFISDPEILACSLRLGRNITPTVPPTHAHFIRAQPSFIEQSPQYLIWSWPDNLDTYHWACIFSITGHIYRKNEFIKIFRLVANENFLLLEKKAPKYLITENFFISNNLLSFFEFMDYALEKFLYKFTKINPQPIVFNFFVKYLFKFKIFEKNAAKNKMISLAQSVTASISLNSSHEDLKNVPWLEKSFNQFSKNANSSDKTYSFISNDKINQKYLRGYVFSHDVISSMKFDEPCFIDPNKIIGVNFEKYIDLV